MGLIDSLGFSWRAIARQRFRSVMLLLAVAIGVLAVNLLTGLAQGGKRYVLGEFRFLGADVLIVVPGKKETSGGVPPLSGETARDLSLADAAAVERQRGVRAVAPLIAGRIEVSHHRLSREAFIIGTNRDFFHIRQLEMARGRMLPEMPMDQARGVCVIGDELRRELYGSRPALGTWLRAGDSRYRVIGVLKDKGEGLGFDLNESLIIPVASAQALFNQEGLFRLFVELRRPGRVEHDRAAIIKLLRERHEGEEDVTLISQDTLLGAFENLLDTLTLAVAGVAAISMVVAGVLIMNVSLISVAQRTTEIGLLKALGCPARTVAAVFLWEAAIIAFCGAAGGVMLSHIALYLITAIYPDIPFGVPPWVAGFSVLMAVLGALLFSAVPATRAARLEPVAALQGEIREQR